MKNGIIAGEEVTPPGSHHTADTQWQTSQNGAGTYEDGIDGSKTNSPSTPPRRMTRNILMRMCLARFLCALVRDFLVRSKKLARRHQDTKEGGEVKREWSWAQEETQPPIGACVCKITRVV